jgi:hypothetical protein
VHETHPDVPIDAALGIYPNPVRETAHVEITLPHASMLDHHSHVLVRDLIGRTVGAASANYFQTSSTTLAIDLPRLPAGLYSLSIENGAEVFGTTFVKIH